MCEFVSFVFVPATEEVFAGSLDSHSGIEAGWDLKPGSYRECEWTQDASVPRPTIPSRPTSSPSSLLTFRQGRLCSST